MFHLVGKTGNVSYVEPSCWIAVLFLHHEQVCVWFHVFGLLFSIVRTFLAPSCGPSLWLVSCSRKNFNMPLQHNEAQLLSSKAVKSLPSLRVLAATFFASEAGHSYLRFFDSGGLTARSSRQDNPIRMHLGEYKLVHGKTKATTCQWYVMSFPWVTLSVWLDSFIHVIV